MRDITELEKAEAQAMCDAVARQMKTRNKTIGKADEADEAGLTFSGQATFSDTGNDKADFNFDDFNKKAKAETALFTIKRLVARSQSGVQDSIKKFILQRQSTIAANKKKKEEAEKLRRNGWQST
jgi:hypothetical protein